MAVVAYCSVAFLLGSIVWWWWGKKKHPRFPPGPTGVPFLGVLPFVSAKPYEVFKRWSLEKYGPIMSVRMTNCDFVILNTYDAMHQTFVKQESQFSGRAYNAVLCQNGGRNGISLQQYGTNFERQKQFGQEALLGSTFNCKTIDDVVNEEVDCFIEMLAGKCDKQSINIKDSIARATANIMGKLTINMRFGYDNNTHDHFLVPLEHLFGDVDDGAMLGMLHLFDFLGHVPPFSGVSRRYSEREQAICNFVREHVKQHRKDFDPEHPRDFVDAFLAEQQSGSNNDSFTDDQLIYLVREFFVTGTVTLISSFSWMVVILLHFPEHCQTMREEIDAQLEKDEKLTLSLKEDMPFTSAMVQEAFRFRTVGPTTLPHETTEDSELSGYFIPKGIRVVANLWGIHNDPETWKNPEQFDPYRHIDEQGKFVFSNKVVSSSMGPRACPGQRLAQLESFVFVAKLVKNFTLLPDEKGLPSLVGVPSIFYAPFPYEVRMKKRE